MTKATFSLIGIIAIPGCSAEPSRKSPAAASTDTSPVSGPFTSQELPQFAALDPIDTHTHTHIDQTASAFLALLQKLNLHVLDILVAHTPDQKAVDTQSEQAWYFVKPPAAGPAGW